MKKIIYTFLFSVSLLFSYSAEVPENNARLIALNWINSLGINYYTDDSISTVFAKKIDGNLKYYVVSFNKLGWVIVSASDLTEPVLAYSTESEFSQLDMPPQVSAWMDNLSDEISIAERDLILPSNEIKQKWLKLNFEIIPKQTLKSVATTLVGPLTSAVWNQGRYYNELAPADPMSSAGNGHVWIGCVATAMAQIMKYWEYPATGMGYHSYLHPDYGNLYADFGNTTYNWSAMPNYVNSQNLDVQRINYHAAVAVDMDFGPGSSGAYLSEANTGLINYFKYNNTIFEASKSRWDLIEWIEQMKRDLDAGRPILYSGYNATYTSGHAWVCDGYSSGDYFHFNWGWGGTYNGNYLLTSLNPGSYNFSYDQAALFGIEPVLPVSIPVPFSMGFEAGNGAISLLGVASITNNEVHTGSQSLLLGKESIVSYATNSASICFVVPEDAELNFWVKRHSPESSPNNQQMAFLMPQFGTTPLITIYDGDFNDTDWISYNVNLESFAGQVVRLLFSQKVNDFSKQQWMYIDDISIVGISSNLQPYTPSAPIPSNMQNLVTLTPTLHWNGGDPNGDNLSYSIYFGTQNNPPLVTTTTENYFIPQPLTHTTTYYWKIVSDDGFLSAESPVWSFTTKGIPPDVQNCGITNITANSATVCGRIVNENGTVISARGICWTDTSIPSLSTEHIESQDSFNTFSCNITGLMPYTTYNCNAFAYSNQGIGYSPIVSFNTLPDLPQIEISEVFNILRSSAAISGSLIRINDNSISKRGAVWSQTPNFDPSSAEKVFEIGNWKDPGNFIINLANLPGPGSFFVRLFAENTAGISFSEELMFVTPNLSPFIDLDANNSKGAGGSDYLGTSTEQMNGGVLCDYDVIINDPDGDFIEKIDISINNPVDQQLEILTINSFFENLVVSGDSTNHMELSSSIPFSSEQWQMVLKNIEYLNLLDSPNPGVVRNINVKVFDGINWSNTAIAKIHVIQVNDPPVIQIPPDINREPVFGGNVVIVPGKWEDSLDECNGEFNFRYWFQVKDADGFIEIVEPENNYFLSISQRFCGKSIRVVEEVTDVNCGGSNVAKDTTLGLWHLVGQAIQNITIDNIPLHYYHEHFFKISGTATSGLPLTFNVPENNTITISNDTVYMLNTGTIVISGAQPGNVCFLPSMVLYKIVTIARGSQEIICENALEVQYSDFAMELPAIATSGLDIVVTSSDSSIAYVNNDSIYINNAGAVTLNITQPGNNNYFPAIPVVVELSVLKSSQVITHNQIPELFFGQGNVPLQAQASSSLNVEVSSSDMSIIQFANDSIIVKGVGNAFLTISQDGDQNWNPAEVVIIPVTVHKGKQQIIVDDFGLLKFTDSPYLPHFHSTSGLPVDVSIADTTIACIENGHFVFKKGGQTSVFFTQTGDSFWEPVSVEKKLIINRADQFITFNQIENKKYGDPAFVLNAFASSGLDVYYAVGDSEVGTITDGYFEIQNSGYSTITAYQHGNDQWNGAVPVSVGLKVNKQSQLIYFSLPDTVILSDKFLIADIISTSGLPVVISSSDNNIIKINGDTLVLLSSGEVKLLFNQSGNRNFEPVSADANIYVYEPVLVPSYSSQIQIYPNPSSSIFNIVLDTQYDNHSVIIVTNLVGEKILQVNSTGKITKLDLSKYPAGIYFVSIESQVNTVVQKLLLK